MRKLCELRSVGLFSHIWDFFLTSVENNENSVCVHKAFPGCLVKKICAFLAVLCLLSLLMNFVLFLSFLIFIATKIRTKIVKTIFKRSNKLFFSSLSLLFAIILLNWQKGVGYASTYIRAIETFFFFCLKEGNGKVFFSKNYRNWSIFQRKHIRISVCIQHQSFTDGDERFNFPRDDFFVCTTIELLS